MDCRTVIEALPAYSLGALDEPERREVAHHLRVCASCRMEFEHLHQQVSALGLLVWVVPPPPHLEQRVVQAALRAAPRQLHARSIPRFWEAVRHWGSRAALAFSAAALILAAVTSGVLLHLNAQLAAQVQQQRAVAAALQARAAELDQILQLVVAADTRVFDMQGTELAQQARGRCYVNPKLGMGWLYVENLRPLPAGRVYQLWLLFDGERISGGTFRVDQSGSGSLLFRAPGRLATYSGAGITEEPEGGSPGPTTPRLLGAALPSREARVPAQEPESIQYDH
jgi:anti-sigma-K factor RskA